MSAIALVVGWLVPWVLGAALIAALPRRQDAPAAGELPWSIGSGWFVGALLLSVWMRVLSAAGVSFGVAAIGAPLLLLSALLVWIAWRRGGCRAGPLLRGAWRGLAGADLPGRRRAAWLALSVWIALRFALLLGEVVTRPLYPWDAWTQWATKARVWYELRTMVPFASALEWGQANGSAYFDAAPHYPATVPLWQVWSCLLLGRWDDALMNLPWWCTAVALALALYGFLRSVDFGALASLLGTSLVITMPILDTHVALAGYADLPMAAYLALSVLAGYRWFRSRSPHDLVTALILTAALPLIKNPGRAWLLLLLPGIGVAAAPRRGLWLAGSAFAIAAAIVLVAAQTNLSLLGYRMDLQFDMPWRGLLDAYFNYANWHLLWYAVVAAIVLGYRQLFAPAIASLTVIVFGAMLMLLFGFAFTNARLWVDDQSTVNRATLHVAPLVYIWVILVFRQWASDAMQRRRDDDVAAQVPPGQPTVSNFSPP